MPVLQNLKHQPPAKTELTFAAIIYKLFFKQGDNLPEVWKPLIERHAKDDIFLHAFWPVGRKAAK